MSGILLTGPVRWSLSRDHDGYREYKVTRRVRTTSVADGPFQVLCTPGLTSIGAMYAFGNDLDPWVWCYPDARIGRISGLQDGEPGCLWDVEQTFGNKQTKRCQDVPIEDPLMEPQKVSGSFTNYTEPATYDKDGYLIQLPSFELLKGPEVEFDKNRPTVRIEQNVANLGLGSFSAMVDKVNDDVLWGMPARCVKLRNVTWDRKIWGSCGYYYTRTFDFEIRYEEVIDGVTVAGFDKYLPQCGEKVLRGKWLLDSGVWAWALDYDGNDEPPDPYNPLSYIRFTDTAGNPASVILNNDGTPWDGTGDVPRMLVQKYEEANFLTLGIPTSF